MNLEAEKEFLNAVKTVLLYSPVAGVNMYMYKIYADECNRHYFYVNTYDYSTNEIYKEFTHEQINEAIEYWWEHIRDLYRK